MSYVCQNQACMDIQQSADDGNCSWEIQSYIEIEKDAFS